MSFWRLPVELANRLTTQLILGSVLAGCATVTPRYDWEDGLRNDAIALLGELHDNAEHHRQRLEVLRRAFAAGWRPAIAMEQFDRERQGDIERARRERPRDAQHVISLGASAAGASSGNWTWGFYRPFVALALEYGVPLIAANLSNAAANKVVRVGYDAVFDADALSALKLNDTLPPALQAMQEREIDIGHCNALPPKMLPAMARAQFARDAVMASIMERHASNGIVLLAGNNHVRRDIGVPRWLSPAQRARTLAVGYFEHGTAAASGAGFDFVVHTAAAARADPCITFKKRLRQL